MRYLFFIVALFAVAELIGCAAANRRTASRIVDPVDEVESADRPVTASRQREATFEQRESEPAITLASMQVEEQRVDSERETDARKKTVDSDSSSPDLPFLPDPLELNTVIASVHQSFPLLESAYLDIDVANGNQLAAWGAFDTKLKAVSENGPTGFYQTYRQNAGLVKPIYEGGEAFAGYRIGRGDFQPWYLERQTNDGGEFKAGFNIPLLRDRQIDARRADLWRATYDQQRVRPEIQVQLIQFVRDGTVAYWTWIAAGRRYEIGEQALQLSERRNSQLQRRIEEGDLDPPELQDNLRSIAQRRAKLIDIDRKLEQSAIKLSLFYRESSGDPVIAADSQLTPFPNPVEVLPVELDYGIQTALSQRPELAALDALYRSTNVDLAEARNDFLPNVDAQISGSQDVGEPTSKKRDKSEFELEAGLFVDVPLERRKARGKSQAASAKLRQIVIKRRFTQDKIVTDVQSAYAALTAAYNRVEEAREARRLAEYMADVERRKQELGQSDLLKVFLREQYAIEAANGEVDSLLDYFVARADYAMALAIDWPGDAVSL